MRTHSAQLERGTTARLCGRSEHCVAQGLGLSAGGVRGRVRMGVRACVRAPGMAQASALVGLLQTSKGRPVLGMLYGGEVVRRRSPGGLVVALLGAAKR